MNKILCLFVCLLLLGCNPSTTTKAPVVVAKPTPKPAVCLPTGKRIEPAFVAAKAALKKTPCVYQFDAILTRLLTISEGDPQLRNKQRFSAFLQWSQGQGIISQKQAKTYYTRYFGLYFMTLPRTGYTTCSMCPKVAQLRRQLHAEVGQKKIGLLRVSGDKKTYQKAVNDHNALQTILKAVCHACANH